jgi:hypothetical protein
VAVNDLSNDVPKFVTRANAALLKMTEDAEQLRRNVSRLIEQGEYIANKSFFQTMLSNANRELVSLLHDVGGVQNDPLLDEWNNRRVKKLLMRADQAMYSQKKAAAEPLSRTNRSSSDDAGDVICEEV